MFLKDCEEYITSAPRIDFRTDIEKIRWFSAILSDAKKQIWWNERNAIIRDFGEPTWKQYSDWCLNQVRNPAIKSHDIGRLLAKV